MTNKEKQWKKVVSVFKAEAKKRYQVGDIIPVGSSTGDYRITKRSSYRVYFDKNSDYETSTVTVTVSHGNNLVGVVYNGFRGVWTIPWKNNDEMVWIDGSCEWDTPKELLVEFKKYLDYDTEENASNTSKRLFN